MKKSKQVRGPRRNVLVAGDKINQLRLERGWTQEDLADVSNVSLSTIKRSLRSVDAKISYQVATDLAAALEVRLSQIGFGVETAHVEAQHHARFARNGSTETVESRLTKDRFEQLYEVAVGFTQSYANEYGVQCEVSPSFLYQAAYKAYDQILASHQTSDAAYGVFRSNGYFRAAALSLNIARYRPIWVSGDVEAAEEQDFLDLALINEIFRFCSHICNFGGDW